MPRVCAVGTRAFSCALLVGVCTVAPALAGEMTPFRAAAVGPEYAGGAQTLQKKKGRPSINSPSAVTIAEDTTSGVLPFTVQHSTDDPATIVVTASSSDPVLLPASGLVVGGSGSARNILVTPAPDRFGVASVTLLATDLQGRTDSTRFGVTVTSVNDTPTISALQPITVEAGQLSAAMPFTVDDIDTPPAALIVTASSSDTVLLPASAILLGGSGTARTVALQPPPGPGGTATVTLVVSDGVLTTSGSFLATVTPTVQPPNQPPVVSAIGPQSMAEDGHLTVGFTVSDPDDAVTAIGLTVSATQPSLLPPGTLVLGGSGAARTLDIGPPKDASGSSDITIIATDPHGLSAASTFTLTVSPVNDPPTISAIPPATVGAGSQSAPIGFTVGDVESPATSLAVTAASSDPAILPGSGLVLGGTGAARTITLRPPSGQGGTVTVTVSVSDGQLTTSQTFQVTVTRTPPTHEPPVISSIGPKTMAEDGQLSVSFTIADPDGPVTALRVSVSATQTQLLPTGSLQFGGSGTSRTLDIAPARNANGTSSITITVSDADGLSASSTFTLTVTPVNDGPTISLIPDQQTPQDTPTPPIPFQISDPDDPTNPAFGLTLQGSSSNQVLVRNPGIAFGGSGISRTVTVTPELGQSGTTVITVRVSDAAGLTATAAFALSVTSVPCIYTLTPASLTLAATGGTATVQVDTAGRASCGWTASTADAWITVVSPAPGAVAFGRGGVQLSIAPNTSPQPRTGTVGIGTKTLTVTQAGTPASGDGDGDGLPDAWEQQFGLDPASSSAASGAAGDPDGDGVSNLDEYRNGTHPRGFVTRYLAEGATGIFFDTQLALANPLPTTALVLLHFLRDDGQRFEQYLVVPPLSRRTIDVGATVAGLPNAAFATEMESDGVVAFDRTMRWDASSYGAHAETSVAQPRTTWYLAEGATHSGFNLFYLVENPNPSATDVTVTFLRPAPAPPLVRTYTVGATSRFSLWVGTSPADPPLQNVDVSAIITSTQPVVVERAMYLSRPGEPMAAGHDGAAIEAPDTDWYLAEGATSPFFNTFILLANPSSTDATVEVEFLREGTGPLQYVNDPRTGATTFVLSANSRQTIWANLVPGLASAGFSTRVHVLNNTPILVERAMWWPGPASSWYESHVSAATAGAGVSWAMADGEAGGPAGVDTFVLIANPSAALARARTTLLFENGTTATREDLVPGDSRRTVWVSASQFLDTAGQPVTVAGQRFGIVVDSVADPVNGPPTPTPIVVERAMYWDAIGEHWAAGTNVVATRLR